MGKIAVVGSGIGSIAASFELKKEGHEVHLFEKNDYFGGHTHTHKFRYNDYDYTIDTGFLVHNDRTYPHLIEFFKELEIDTYPSDMTFSVRSVSDDLEWSGDNLFTVFAQKKNLLRPRFYLFLKEILRFNKFADKYIQEAKENLNLSLGDILQKYKYSDDFQNWYLLPMGGCIWSSPTLEMLKFPAYAFLTFCKNHGLLQVNNRPQWKTVIGGCDTYTKKVISLLDGAYKNEGVLRVEANELGVHLITEKQEIQFDAVVFGCHPPQTKKMLEGVDPEIQAILSCFNYQKNIAYLHTDETQLPKRKPTWSAWNYKSINESDKNKAVSVSYLINKIQPLPNDVQMIVTLNPFEEIDSKRIIKVLNYEHPLFDKFAIEAQERIPGIQGRHGLYFSGAWMRNGFHEDGIWGAMKAVKKLKLDFNEKKMKSKGFDQSATI